MNETQKKLTLKVLRFFALGIGTLIVGYMTVFPIVGFVIFIALDLISGTEVSNSEYIGKEVEIYPVAKIINYGYKGRWENEVNKLGLKEGRYPLEHKTVFELTEPTTFKVTRVRRSHTGFKITYTHECYFTSVKDPNLYFVEQCKKIEELKMTTEFLKSSEAFFHKNKQALVVMKDNHGETYAKRVFLVNRATIYEVLSFEKFLSLQQQGEYRYESILFNRSVVLPFSEKLKESEFYKYDYDSISSQDDSVEKYLATKDFKHHVIPQEIENWIMKNYPTDPNIRWALKRIYLSEPKNENPINIRRCFEGQNGIKNFKEIVTKLNRETSASIDFKDDEKDLSRCYLTPPMILDPRFEIVAD